MPRERIYFPNHMAVGSVYFLVVSELRASVFGWLLARGHSYLLEQRSSTVLAPRTDFVEAGGGEWKLGNHWEIFDLRTAMF